MVSPAPSWKRPAAFALGGVGLLGVTTAIVTGVLLPAQKRSVDDNCDTESRSCNDVGAAAARRGRTLLGLNTASWIVGAVGIGAGVGLYVAGTPAGDGAHFGISGALF